MKDAWDDLDIRLRTGDTKKVPGVWPGPRRGSGRPILILGILGLFGCPFFGVTAWFWGRRELVRIREGEIDSVNEGRVRAGMILGVVGVVYALVVSGLLVAIVSVAYRAFIDFLTAFTTGGGRMPIE